MRIALMIEIIKLALGIIQARTDGTASDVAETSKTLIQIAQRVNRVYETETGQPLDVEKIKRWEAIDPEEHGV